MKTHHYAGIGSRKTPLPTLELMRVIGTVLGQRGWILRSGGAEGADSAFEWGAKDANAIREIYLPWERFNHSRSPLFDLPKDAEAERIASSIHPRWAAVSPGGRKLHARNVYQVLGHDLQTPSEFVICWTPGGEEVGGTRTAIVLARQHSIPVFNLGSREGYLQFYRFIES